MNNDDVLVLQNVEVDYGIVKAVKGVNINVKKGSIVAILGANGAGKTSLIKAISGVTKVKTGAILYKGQSIKNLAPYKIVQKGITQSPEGRLIVGTFTVLENLLLGAYSLKAKKIESENGIVKISRRKRIQKLLEEVFFYFPILKERRKQLASTLSGGEQQMLAIGRALMGEPDLLLMDEPSLGLAPLIIKDIFTIIKKIKDDGRTIFLVEQNAKQTLKIADYAYVLSCGIVKTHGKASELIKDETLIDAYLGGT